MLGRFGIVFVLIAVLACTGIISTGVIGGLHMNMTTVPGAVIMIAAVILAMLAGRIAAGLPEEKRQSAIALIKLGAVVLCGVGALVVFSG